MGADPQMAIIRIMETHPNHPAHVRFICLTTALLALVLVCPQVAGAAVNPRDFVVNLNGGPDVKPVIPMPTGITPPAGCDLIGGLPPSQVRCPVTYHLQQSALTLSATATDTSSGATGTMNVTCDVDANLDRTVLVTLASNAVSYEALSGTGTENCSWQITFGTSDSLTGVLSGTMAMGLGTTTPNTAVWSGSFNVTVMGGSGAYAGLNGSGTFEQSETVGLPTTSQQSMSRASTARAATPDASAMHLALQPGKPGVRILTPKRNAKLRSTARDKISVITAPGATCTFQATRKGMKPRTLGTVRDGSPADGRMATKSRVARGLARGTWTLTASCTVGKKTGTASVKVKIV